MSETDFYCPDCKPRKFILTETSSLIDKTGGCTHFMCGKCGSVFYIEFTFEKEPNLKKEE